MNVSQQLSIEVLTPSIGAIINGFDLSQPLTPNQKHALEQALYKYHVLFFPNQNLTPEQQRDFAAHFGQLHVHPIYSHASRCPEVAILEFGQGFDPNKQPDSDTWHTDVTFSAHPPIIGMLYAKVVLKQGGGDTLWANMVEIYKQELSNGMKEILRKLTAEHSIEKSFKPSINDKHPNMNKFRKAK